MSLYFPNFASDVIRRRSRVDPARPVVVWRLDHQRELVVACCAKAQALGIRALMSVAEARALCPGGKMHSEALDPPLLARTLRRLALRAMRFTPRVAIDPPDGLWLDLSGCTHLFGGTEPAANAVRARFEQLALSARAAIAPTWGGAWALARFAPSGICVCTPETLGAVLSPLPARALRITPEQDLSLAQVGICTIALVLAVPRDDLALRFGQSILLALDRAVGRQVESIRPVRLRQRLREALVFGGPTDRIESVQHCVGTLITKICQRLSRSESACRLLTITLHRSDLEPVVIAQRCVRASRDRKHWQALVMPQVERAHLGFGVEGVDLEAAEVVRAPHEQGSYLDQAQRARQEHLDQLLDTLIARLGDTRVLRAGLRDTHIPERAIALAPAGDAATLSPALSEALPDRPSRLLARPIPAEVVLMAPEGPILSVRSGSRLLTIRTCHGPERIGAEWWRGQRGERDYYRLLADDASVLWVYRSTQDQRWFIHGEWA